MSTLPYISFSSPVNCYGCSPTSGLWSSSRTWVLHVYPCYKSVLFVCNVLVSQPLGTGTLNSQKKCLVSFLLWHANYGEQWVYSFSRNWALDEHDELTIILAVIDHLFNLWPISSFSASFYKLLLLLLCSLLKARLQYLRLFGPTHPIQHSPN